MKSQAWLFLEVKLQDVSRKELLGRGSYAEVFSGLMRGTTCAIKVYRNVSHVLKEGWEEIRCVST